MTEIRDIMSEPVVAVRPETTLAEAMEILTQLHVGGAPVVSANGTLIGIISDQALIDVVFDAAARCAPVSQYMTPDVQYVQPGDPLSRAAQLFALYSYRRLPVVEVGKLVGIVSRRDLINHSLRSNELLTEPLLELIPELAQLS
jgi:tRNA nucleotidyltransferase (CCA-adding enzyme)